MSLQAYGIPICPLRRKIRTVHVCSQSAAGITRTTGISTQNRDHKNCLGEFAPEKRSLVLVALIVARRRSTTCCRPVQSTYGVPLYIILQPQLDCTKGDSLYGHSYDYSCPPFASPSNTRWLCAVCDKRGSAASNPTLTGWSQDTSRQAHYSVLMYCGPARGLCCSANQLLGTGLSKARPKGG